MLVQLIMGRDATEQAKPLMRAAFECAMRHVGKHAHDSGKRVYTSALAHSDRSSACSCMVWHAVCCEYGKTLDALPQGAARIIHKTGLGLYGGSP